MRRWALPAAVAVLLLGGGAVAYGAAAPVSIPCTQNGTVVTCTITPVTVTRTVRTTITSTAPASTVTAPASTVTVTEQPTTSAEVSTTTDEPDTTAASTTATTTADATPAEWPGPSNTGVPAGTALTAYTGSCTITTAGAVIDSKTINCPSAVVVRAANVTIKNSKVVGRIVVDTDVNRSWSLTLVDSEVDASAGDLPAIYNGNVNILRANIHGGHNGLECQEHSSHCVMKDSWIHGQWQAPSGDTHLGGFLALGVVVPCTGTNGACVELVHNRITCDAPVNQSGGGCTGDINLLPHYGPLPGAIIQNNWLGANVGSSFCTYGGSGMEYPASNIVYTGNVFERGTNSQCAAYGPVTNFDSSAAGNVWENNTWAEDGAPVPPAG